MAGRKRTTHRRKRFTLPLAPIGGMIPVAVGVYNRRNSGTAMANYLQAGFTGISNGSFNIGNFRQGLFPIMVGFIVHTVASKLGINRMLGRSGVPIVRI